MPRPSLCHLFIHSLSLLLPPPCSHTWSAHNLPVYDSCSHLVLSLSFPVWPSSPHPLFFLHFYVLPASLLSYLSVLSSVGYLISEQSCSCYKKIEPPGWRPLLCPLSKFDVTGEICLSFTQMLESLPTEEYSYALTAVIQQGKWCLNMVMASCQLPSSLVDNGPIIVWWIQLLLQFAQVAAALSFECTQVFFHSWVW